MKRYSLFTRGPFVLILLAAGLFFGACAEDPDRLAVDFSRKADVQPKTQPPPGAALNVAVASMISPDETFVHYQALLEYLGAQVDMRINLIQRKTYAEINGLLGSGGIDLAFICSGPYASGRDRYRFEALAVPLVHQKAVYRALLLTHQASAVNRLEDLRGKVFAFSDPDSNAGCFVPSFLLAEKRERPKTFFGKTIFTYSHDNSILAVSRSLVDGAFVHEHIWEYYSQKIPPSPPGSGSSTHRSRSATPQAGGLGLRARASSKPHPRSAVLHAPGPPGGGDSRRTADRPVHPAGRAAV